MNVYLISDTHLNHDKIATYCDRPADFTEIILRNWRNTVRPEDTVIHLGDVLIGNRVRGVEQLRSLPGRKILVRGNHDRRSSCTWWMEHGFDFACDGMKFRNCWLTHEPAASLAEGCELNLHGHLHNIWHGFKPEGVEVERKLRNPWQRLFAIEYTRYLPVEFDKFVMNPDKYLARGLVQSSHGRDAGKHRAVAGAGAGGAGDSEIPGAGAVVGEPAGAACPAVHG